MAKTAPHATFEAQLLELADQYKRLVQRLDPTATFPDAPQWPPEKELYRSSNGDCWYLASEPGSDRMLVRHQPNRTSGGHSFLISIEDFLAEGHGPQQEALLRLMEERRPSSNDTDRKN